MDRRTPMTLMKSSGLLPRPTHQDRLQLAPLADQAGFAMLAWVLEAGSIFYYWGGQGPQEQYGYGYGDYHGDGHGFGGDLYHAKDGSGQETCLGYGTNPRFCDPYRARLVHPSGLGAGFGVRSGTSVGEGFGDTVGDGSGGGFIEEFLRPEFP